MCLIIIKLYYMGQPPKYLVTRKLIRHYFKRYLPKQPSGVDIDYNTLFECWVIIPSYFPIPSKNSDLIILIAKNILIHSIKI